MAVTRGLHTDTGTKPPEWWVDPDICLRGPNVQRITVCLVQLPSGALKKPRLRKTVIPLQPT